MRTLMILLAVLTLAAACGKKADLRTPPAPGEMPVEDPQND